MASSIRLIESEDPSEVADFRCATFGGPAERALSEVARQMRQGKVFVARRRARVIATLCLTTRKPWAIDVSYFSPVRVPSVLDGDGRDADTSGTRNRPIVPGAAARIATDWPADAIRLDAYDEPTGAGGFYERCGYRNVGRAVYRGTPLIYYERLVEKAPAVSKV